MFVPAVGDMNISVRIRLIFSLFVSFVIMSTIESQLPVKPEKTAEFAILIFNEVMVGLSIGIAIKIIQSAIHVAGLVFSYQSGLSSGMIFDPINNTQGSAYGAFLMMSFTMLLIATDMHLLIIKSIKLSYNLFPFGFFIQNYGSFVDLVTKASSDAFNLGVRISAPFFMVGIFLNLGAGILSRLMPQMQVFFILMPIQILVQSVIFMMILGSTMLWLVDYYHDYLKNIFG
jgi:flagellar biosynthetic protein FliR